MTSRSSRNVLTVVLSLLTLAASPAVAAAEVERPSQGEAASGLFLSYAPRPDDEGAVCFVDSGIDENRDTESGIIERTSVAGDGSSGEDGDTDDRHGTSMAMVAGAPRNRWGEGGHLVPAQARRSAGLEQGRGQLPVLALPHGD